MPAALAQMLEEGALDLAIMAALDGFAERFQVKPLYRERFVVAFPPGHRFERQETRAHNRLRRRILSDAHELRVWQLLGRLSRASRRSS